MTGEPESQQSPFDRLTPELILGAVERATGARLTGMLLPLPSYINRVYELRAADNTRLIAKFYRPGRWTRQAIADEHRFVADCASAEIPVVPALTLDTQETIAETDGFVFAVYPRKAGRQLEITDESLWMRLGALTGRLHAAGAERPAPSRVTIHPRHSLRADIEYLCAGVAPESVGGALRTIGTRIEQSAGPLFDSTPAIRIHGDLHRGNILDRLDDGLLVIDFDDMAMGPAAQDLWLLLPERPGKARREIELFLDGYERFRRFDRATLAAIEALRAMRMVYFLAWCSRQQNDFQFRRNNPDWGSARFWQNELNDLREQLGFVEEALEQQ